MTRKHKGAGSTQKHAGGGGVVRGKQPRGAINAEARRGLRGNSPGGERGTGRGCLTQKESTGVFRNAEEVLHADEFPDFAKILPLAHPHLSCLCDVKKAGGDTYYRLSNDKVRASAPICG